MSTPYADPGWGPVLRTYPKLIVPFIGMRAMVGQTSGLQSMRMVWLGFAKDEWAGLNLKGGRQRIKLDDDRWIGNVGWRQNEQTFDALTLNTNAISNTALQYTYVSWVRRIFGQKVDAGQA